MRKAFLISSISDTKPLGLVSFLSWLWQEKKRDQMLGLCLQDSCKGSVYAVTGGKGYPFPGQLERIPGSPALEMTLGWVFSTQLGSQ